MILDAVVALFAAAADLAVRLPGAGVGGFLEMVAEQRVASDPGRGEPTGRSADGVAVLSAHAAKGLDGTPSRRRLQQDDWPDVRGRGPPRARRPHRRRGRHRAIIDRPIRIGRPGPGGERRLFYVATTRARRRLVVTSVEDDEQVPSRFLAEPAGAGPIQHGWPSDTAGRQRRALHLSALVADLRAAVGTEPGRRWTGGRPSRDSPGGLCRHPRRSPRGMAGTRHRILRRAGDPVSGLPVRLSPSQVESVLGCPLRAVLTRNGGAAAPSSSQLRGGERARPGRRHHQRSRRCRSRRRRR